MRSTYVLLGLTLAGCAGRQAPPESPNASVTRLAEATDQRFSNGDVTIRYRDYGRGEPVVLIHGFMRDLNDWPAIGDSLARDHRVIALDLRGHGMSDRPAGESNYGRRMADDVVRLIEHLRLERAHLVGHSLGAVIAANIANRYPNRVSTLTLIAGPFWPDSAAAMGVIGPFITDVEQGRGLTNFIRWLLPSLPPGVPEQVNLELGRTWDGALLVAMMRGMATLMVGSGGEHAAPAFFIVGSDDPLQPLSTELSGRWTGSILQVVQGANHINIAARRELMAGMRAIMARRTSAALPRRRAA